MNVRYDVDVDAFTLRLADGNIIDSEETKPGLIVDYDEDGKIVALEFLKATEWFSTDAIKQFSQAA